MNYRVEELPLDMIDAEDRAREDYSDIDKLAHSIREKGLMHNLVVYHLPNEPKAKLIAGGRRLKAVKDFLGWQKVPCRVYDHFLTDLELKALELEENLQRSNLTMVEEVKLKQEIHELYVAMKGEKISRAPDAPGHSQSDTAKLLGESHATVSMDLKLAKAMEEFPDIQWEKFKNKHEAMKCLNTISTSLDRMQKSQDIQQELGSNQCRAALMIKNYVIGDFFTKITECPDNYFDLIEVDPPYAIDLTRVKKGYNDPGYNKTGYNEISEGDYPAFLYNTFFQCYKKAAQNSWMICWFGPDPWFQIVRDLAEKAGWKTTGLVGIWSKGKEDEDGISEANAGQTHMPTKRLANAYEMFYYCWKGDPSLAKPGRSNVFGYKPVPHTKKIHPTERPLEMISDVLQTFAHPGANVLVPFAGSGNTLLAAMLCDMKGLGFDLTEGYRDGYVIRVQEIFT